MSVDENAPVTNSVTVKLTEDDLLQAKYLHAWDSFWSPGVIIYLMLVWLVMMAFFAFYEGLMKTPWILSIFGLLLAILLPTARFLGLSLACPIYAGRDYRQDKTIHQPFSATWDREFYQIERPGVLNRLPWSDYFKWRENQYVFVFYISGRLFHILPKRVLSQSQIEAIQDILLSSGK